MGREERVRWENPRPGYVRESEPAGLDIYFKSVPFIEFVDPGTVSRNRELALRDTRGGRPPGKAGEKIPTLRKARGRVGHPE